VVSVLSRSLKPECFEGIHGCSEIAGIHTIETSTVSQDHKEPPGAEAEKHATSTQDTCGSDQVDALSDMRESLRQQLKMRKKRAAEEPLDMVLSSLEPNGVTSQHPAELLVARSVTDGSNGAHAMHKDVEIIAETLHRAPAAEQSKDQKLVCLEFCQCVCLMEEPVASGSQAHTHAGMCVCVQGACPPAPRFPFLCNCLWCHASA
jgi:hypothetical protein